MDSNAIAQCLSFTVEPKIFYAYWLCKKSNLFAGISEPLPYPFNETHLFSFLMSILSNCSCSLLLPTWQAFMCYFFTVLFFTVMLKSIYTSGMGYKLGTKLKVSWFGFVIFVQNYIWYVEFFS